MGFSKYIYISIIICLSRCQSICLSHFVVYSNLTSEFECDMKRDTQTEVEWAVIYTASTEYLEQILRESGGATRREEDRKQITYTTVHTRLVLQLLFNIIIFLNLKSLSHCFGHLDSWYCIL